MYSVLEIKALLSEQNIRINKRLGQNFLVDKNYQQRILELCSVAKTDTILEIGPGLGALTGDLVLSCGELIAVEYDKKLFEFLKNKFSEYTNFKIIHSDILKYIVKSAEYAGKLKVVGNLPYYITSPVIAYLVDNREYIDFAFLTVQKEVAERIVSGPGSKVYGSLSCFVQFYCKPEIILNIPRKAFYPQPSVESSLLKLEYLKRPSVKVDDEVLFFKIVRAAFGKRRKTILNAILGIDALGSSKDEISGLLSSCGIDPQRRGETLNLEEFARIAQKGIK